jgi:hypothetical protein
MNLGFHGSRFLRRSSGGLHFCGEGLRVYTKAAVTRQGAFLELDVLPTAAFLEPSEELNRLDRNSGV